MRCNQSRPGFELVSLCPFPTTITITPRAPRAFLAQLPVAHLPQPVVSSLIYTFCANLLHSLIMWLIVSSLSPHNLHLLFCCVLSIFAVMEFVLTTLFYAAIRSDSVSLLRFPFLSHYYYYYSYSLRVFHISNSKWSFAGVWVTASLLRSPGLVSGFWLFSAMLSFG